MKVFSVLKNHWTICTLTLLVTGLVTDQAIWAQPEGDRPPPRSDGGPEPRLRFHEVTQSDGQLQLIAADVAPTIKHWTSIEIGHDKRVISANGVPRHNTGIFPNAGNPNVISAQSYTYSITMQPK